MLFMLVAGWLPEGIADFFNYLFSDYSQWQMNYKLLVSLLILCWFAVQLNTITASQSIKVNPAASQPSKVLALFLSPLHLVGKRFDDRGQEQQWLGARLLQPALTLQDFEDTTWYMPLKAIDFHVLQVEYLYLLTSSGEHGTQRDVSLFIEIINRLYPAIATIKLLRNNGLDFDNVEAVFDAVEELYHDAAKKEYKENEVLVDITGGKKTNSIAASFAVLARGRKFQYISYDKLVTSYDVEYVSE